MKKSTAILVAIGLYLALLILHDLLMLSLTAGVFRRRHSQDAFGFARMSAKPVVEAYEKYYRSGYYKFRELIGDLFRLNPDLLRLSLVDVGGRVLFDSDEFDGGRPDTLRSLDDAELLRWARGLEAACRVSQGTDGGALLDIVAPHVEEWGRHRYSVRFQIRSRAWDRQQVALWLRVLLAGAFSLVVGAIAIALLGSRMAAPRPDR